MMFMPSFIKTHQLIQKLFGMGKHMDMLL